MLCTPQWSVNQPSQAKQDPRILEPLAQVRATYNHYAFLITHGAEVLRYLIKSFDLAV